MTHAAVRNGVRERSRQRRERLRAAGMCQRCGEVPAASTCDDCKADRRFKDKLRREREPTVTKLEIALWHVRAGEDLRGALDRAGILGPLLRGEI